jgi:hypothetical protein
LRLFCWRVYDCAVTRLYVVYKCPFGHRAAIVLREKKVDFEIVFFEPGKRPPELDASRASTCPRSFRICARGWNAWARAPRRRCLSPADAAPGVRSL